MDKTFAQLGLNIDDKGKADLDAAVSGLVDRYLAIVSSVPECSDPATAIRTATVLAVNDIGQEAKRRLGRLDQPAERRLAEIMTLAEKMATMAGFMLAGLPHLVTIVAYGQLASGVRIGLTAPLPPIKEAKR